MIVRLNHFIAMSGIASRRGAEKLIKAGKIKVNNVLTYDLSTKVNTDLDSITYLDKTLLVLDQEYIYIKFNKPKGCICSFSDEKGRKTIFDYINVQKQRLFSVGRLDYNTEGLLLLTNDGQLANKLMHPSNNVSKKYLVKLDSSLSALELSSIRKGIRLDDEYTTKPAIIENYTSTKNESSLYLTITEGKNRQIHRMFETIDKKVTFLKRVSYGPISLGRLERGQHKNLSPKEIYSIKNYI